jgi:hypothetical protein
MTERNWLFTILVLAVSLTLTGCTAPTPAPTATAAPTAIPTSLPTATTTPRPTATTEPSPTVEPSPTGIPEPATLTGSIFMTGKQNRPLATFVELHPADEEVKDAPFFEGVSAGDGNFRIKNIKPGLYDVWVQISDRPAMPAGCQEVSNADASSLLGIGFDEGMSLSAETDRLSLMVMLADGFKGTAMKAERFYTIVPKVKIPSGGEVNLDIRLVCE